MEEFSTLLEELSVCSDELLIVKSISLRQSKLLAQCEVVNRMLHTAKEHYYSTIISDNANDQRVLFQTVAKLLEKNSDRRYPSANSDSELADAFSDYFFTKIDGVRQEVLGKKNMSCRPFGEIDEVICTSSFDSFFMLTAEDVVNLINDNTIKSCSHDPVPCLKSATLIAKVLPIFDQFHS